MELNGAWIINKELSKKEKEALFIVLEAAGMPVFESCRQYETDTDKFPYIGYGGHLHYNSVCGWRSPYHSDMQVVTYEQVIEASRKLITKQSEEVWTR